MQFPAPICSLLSKSKSRVTTSFFVGFQAEYHIARTIKGTSVAAGFLSHQRPVAARFGTMEQDRPEPVGTSQEEHAG
jgi:hypothetical protein